MKEIYRACEFTRIGNYQSILESAGIATEIRNQSPELIGLGQSIAPSPSLWVVNPSDYDKAADIIRKLHNEREHSTGAEIPCPSCHESNPGNFEICWNCGAALGNGSDDPSPGTLTEG